MMRKIGYTLLWASSLLTPTVFATTNHNFTQGLSIEYDFPVNEPQVFSNIFFWTIKASCVLTSETPENFLSVKMLHKSGSVNNMRMISGDTMTITIPTGERIDISADSGAKVELVNIGNKNIKANCSTV